MRKNSISSYPGSMCRSLTDAFASGHIVAKKQITEQAQTAWGKQSAPGWFFPESAFTKSVSAAILGDPKVSKRLAKKQLRLIQWGAVSKTRFSEFLWKFAGKEPGKFFNGFAVWNNYG